MKLLRYKNLYGFALIEVLIAAAVLSIILLSIYSGIATSVNVITRAQHHTTATMLAKSKMNEFILDRFRGMDVNEEPIENFDRFYFSIETIRYENPFLGPLPANQTTITISWKESNREKKYELIYIYPTN